MKALLALLFLFYVAEVKAVAPAVDISYNESVDWLCSVFRGSDIKEEWQSDLKNRLPEFEQQWNAVGPKLLTEVEKFTGKSFPQEQIKISAHLTLCDVPSDSFLGTVVNMRYALASYTTTPVSLQYKISVLFHEMLHKFLDEHLPTHSRLLSEHQGENKRVLNHLHLLALEKAVYLRLGLAEELKEVIAVDGQLPNGAYKRAWELVNRTDNKYIKYVDELRVKQ
jgi:hypothetical protein